MRVMVDTNILISGMVFDGSERRLLDVIRKRHIVVVDDYRKRTGRYLRAQYVWSG
ncbi:MAG TPA: hypothetical protein VLK32_02515 [Bacillota bacterium]|nr:hypothetical protein [Bacillota bacterium]